MRREEQRGVGPRLPFPGKNASFPEFGKEVAKEIVFRGEGGGGGGGREEQSREEGAESRDG